MTALPNKHYRETARPQTWNTVKEHLEKRSGGTSFRYNVYCCRKMETAAEDIP